MSLDLENLKTKDPFNDWETDETASQQGLVHIRIQQRNGRKTLTTCQGIPEEFDLKKILKAFKKVGQNIFTFLLHFINVKLFRNFALMVLLWRIVN